MSSEQKPGYLSSVKQYYNFLVIIIPPLTLEFVKSYVVVLKRLKNVVLAR